MRAIDRVMGALTRSPELGMKGVLLLYLLIQLFLIGVALWPACWLVLKFATRASSATHWMLLILGAVVVFNYAYVLGLLALRLVIPKSKPGFYPNGPDGSPPKEAIVFMLNVLLAKARFHPPWAGIFSSVLVQIFPLDFLYRRLFGPHTTAMTMGDSCLFLDPYLVEAGRNVQFGFQATVICHYYDNRGLTIDKVKIGDEAVIGGETLLMPGVEIGHHAVVRCRSTVFPGTIIKPYEYWAGTPATKVKDLGEGDWRQEAGAAAAG